ncbi:MAG: radical SAM protein [Thermoguttaceae bacterium]|jgi:DNA repair photolyase
MIELRTADRKSPVLAPARLPCLAGMPTLSLTAGCAHGCVYCYAQGYCNHPGRDRVVLYANLVERLREELARKRRKPEAVFLSPASDPFQPLPEVLDLAWSVLELLFSQGIGVVFLTKGRIPKRHFELIEAHAPLVRAQIGIISVDRKLSRIFEPRAATPRVRLEQCRRLIAAGVATQARADPILPGLTDDPDALHALCAALAGAGVRELAASTLFLRPPLVRILRNRLRRPKMLGRLTDAFQRGKWLALRPGQGSLFALAPARRQTIFDWLSAIARQYGITVRVCGCKNPDLAAGGCNMAGQWSPPELVERQLALFSG